MDNCRFFLFAMACFLVLTACAMPQPPVALDRDGQPLPVLFRIDPATLPMIKARVLDRVNDERRAIGAAALRLDAALNAAALVQSRDMGQRGQAVHIGQDGSSPADRARATGYRGAVLGEILAETYAPDLATLAAWMQQPDTRAVILDDQGRDLGLAYVQDETGKIWWTLLVGSQDASFARPG